MDIIHLVCYLKRWKSQTEEWCLSFHFSHSHSSPRLALSKQIQRFPNQTCHPLKGPQFIFTTCYFDTVSKMSEFKRSHIYSEKNLTYRKNWIWWLAEADSSVYRCGARAPTDWVWWGVWGRKRHLRGPQRLAHLWRDCRQQRQAGDRPESRKVEEDSKYNLRLGQLRSPMWSSVKSQLAFGSCQTRYNISSVLLYPVQAF